MFYRIILGAFLFFASLSSIFVNGSFLFADTGLSASQFAEEAGVAWRNLTDAYHRGLSVRVTRTTPQFLVFQAEVSLLGKDELVQIHPTKTTEGTLYAINSRYSFRLAKKVEDSSRTLVNMWEDPNELRKSEYFDHGLLQATASVFVPIMVESSWLCDLMKSKEMEVTALNEQYVDDEVYVELKFRCRQYFLNGHTKLLGGRILFDKKRYFVIKEYEVQTEFVADGISMNKNEKNSGSDFVDVEKKLEYQEIKGIPYLRRDETTYRKVKSTLKKEIVQFPNNKQTTNTDYEILDSNKVSGEVFFLKHYGFSEPINPLERTNIIRAILVALGLILTFLGLFMKIWARKIERE